MAERIHRPSLPEVRSGLRRRLRRVRSEAWTIAQTGVAAAGAWGLASVIHPRPFFAPVSAVISLGVARGRRTVRAIELVVGVAVGIAVADLIVIALGTGTLVIALVVALAMAAALLLRAGTILVNQAAVSAILVATISPPSSGISPSRFIDALIGGGVALLIAQVLFPRQPAKVLAKAATPVAGDLAVALEATAQALRDGDAERAERALEIARSTEGDLAAFYDAVSMARETFSLTPMARRARERLPLYAEAAREMDYAVRNTRVLARRAVSAVRSYGAAPAPLADAVSLLADAVTALAQALDDPERATAARALAVDAAAQATAVLEDSPGLSVSMIVGQVRSTAVDLLRGSGLDAEEARRALDERAQPDDGRLRR
jgi:uncharacterized membrane protein YgaE (UPF0421/DUF939 family)